MFILAMVAALPAMARAVEVPPSEPLRVQAPEFDYRWRAASSSPFDEPARRYYYGQQAYPFATYYGGWYRPTFYFGPSLYTYRGVGVYSYRGYSARSIQRFHGPVPLRWMRYR